MHSSGITYVRVLLPSNIPFLFPGLSSTPSVIFLSSTSSQLNGTTPYRPNDPRDWGHWTCIRNIVLKSFLTIMYVHNASIVQTPKTASPPGPLLARPSSSMKGLKREPREQSQVRLHEFNNEIAHSTASITTWPGFWAQRKKKWFGLSLLPLKYPRGRQGMSLISTHSQKMTISEIGYISQK